MKQSSSWEAKSLSDSQEISQILWNPKVYYHSHNYLPPAPILSLINPIHACPSQFLNIHFNIFIPPMPRSSKESLSLRSVYQHPACTSPVSHTCHMPHPSRSSIQNTAQFKQLFVSVELQHYDVTSCSLVESCWVYGGTCVLRCQVKINVFRN